MSMKRAIAACLNVNQTTTCLIKTVLGAHRTIVTSSPSIMTPPRVQITSPVFRSLFTPELRKLSDIFKERGYELRIAGGAVRDILMGITPVDIDLATTATPTEMKALFEEKEIRMINVGGEKHGTVTARIDDKENFEITTLRIDKVTDGRWAEVEFTQDWVVDANRRDLTINSMFLDLDGNLFDYFSGSEDLNERKVRFVGDPDKRIQEDYLRILRYFRFFGRISSDPSAHEESTLAAIRRNAEGLKRISGERIWTELRQIIVGKYAPSVIIAMNNSGVLPYLGLPMKLNMDEMEKVWARCHEFRPKPMTMIASLLTTEDEIEALDARIKLSNEECGLGMFVIKHRDSSELLDFCRSHPDSDPLTPYQRLLAEEVLLVKPNDAKSRCVELLKYRGDCCLLQAMEQFEIPKFPVNGPQLVQHGISPGRQIGIVMKLLRTAWVKSDFSKTGDDLVNHDMPIILHNLAHQQEDTSTTKKLKTETESVKTKKERNRRH